MIITNRSRPRLESARKKLQKMYPHAVVEYRHCPEPKHNDAALNLLKPYSLIVNATGLGKDRPGSPITHDGEFPPNSLAWDLNYRGICSSCTRPRGRKRKRVYTSKTAGLIFCMDGPRLSRWYLTFKSTGQPLTNWRRLLLQNNKKEPGKLVRGVFPLLNLKAALPVYAKGRQGSS